MSEKIIVKYGIKGKPHPNGGGFSEVSGDTKLFDDVIIFENNYKKKEG